MFFWSQLVDVGCFMEFDGFCVLGCAGLFLLGCSSLVLLVMVCTDLVWLLFGLLWGGFFWFGLVLIRCRQADPLFFSLFSRVVFCFLGLVPWLVGRSVGRSVGWLVGWLAASLASPASLGPGPA